MSDDPAARSRNGLRWALWGAALLGCAAVLYIIVRASTNPAPEVKSGPQPVAEAPPSEGFAAKLDNANAGKPAVDYVFQDASGHPLKIADFKGKVVVMNLWASWCAPCKIEMPTLAKLAAEYDGKPVEVVAISIDKPEAAEKARAFITENAPLKFYGDPAAKLPWALSPQAAGMPTTVIYGPDGLERGRVAGEADWSGRGAKAFIDKILAEG